VTNSLAALHPDIAAEWDYERNWDEKNNRALTPDEFPAGSSKKVHWKCEKGPDHRWEAIISTRTQAKIRSGCPCCSGRKASVTNNVARFPELVAQWHPDNLLTPDKVVGKSEKEVSWICLTDPAHVWEAPVASRFNKRGGIRGCPFCLNHRASPTNNLAVLYPEIAAEWHPTKNGDLTPDQVLPNSEKRVWWKCPKGPDHEWPAWIQNRRKGDGCPCCGNRQLSVTNCLANFPDVAAQWHPTKNGNVTPRDVIATSGTKYVWKCPQGPDHEWDATPRNRTEKRSGCPYCRGLRPSVTNSLLSLHPMIAAEWHPTENGDRTPDTVVAGSNKSYWWQCARDPSHVWKAVVASRTARGTGCPLCNRGWSLPAIRAFVASLAAYLGAMSQAELQALCQQNGLLTSRHGALIAQAIATGRLTPAGIEEVIAGDAEALLAEETSDVGVAETRAGEIDLSEVVVSDPDQLDADRAALPLVSATDALALLDSPVVSSADAEVVEFLLASALAKLWKHAYAHEADAIDQARAYSGGDYAMRVRDGFLGEYEAMHALSIPPGYDFRIDGQLTDPNLMQRHVAVQVRDQGRVGNWSGTGAGKTLSAILASRVVDAGLTVICCPNSVVAGWKTAILDTFPNSVVATKTFAPKWGLETLTGAPRYLVLNYEAFQQRDSEQQVLAFVRSHGIDVLVVDEIHHTKQRTDDMSKRRRLVTLLASMAAERNPTLRVLGMSATPVLNNLLEGKSLVELITGLSHDDLKPQATVANCMALHRRLVTLGTRWLPDYRIGYEQIEIPVDCSTCLPQIRALGSEGTILKLEQILTAARLPIIREHVVPKTLIYSHYIDSINRLIRDALIADGWRVGFYMGDDKSGLEGFLHGDIDVLIASSAIGTGVDGLQRVCHRLIVNVLPWTAAEFEQLKGRIYRQGQVKDSVTVVLPLTYADVGGERWSWCEAKMARLAFKRSIADAAVDGVVPEGRLRTEAQAYQDLMGWLARLDAGQVQEVVRRPIVIPRSDEPTGERATRYARFGDFSRMNRTWNQAASNVTHQRLQSQPEEWEHYHALYREARLDWPVVPFEEFIRWAEKRDDLVIGDFGCGEALVAAALHDRHTVHSFDHVAIHERVVACDMAHIPLEDASLDVALFSLSLMGSNLGDYLREAHRCLRLDGHLHVFEATSRFRDLDQFAAALRALGFDIRRAEPVGSFTHVWANKSDRTPREIVALGIG
jgi:hypothetical protein